MSKITSQLPLCEGDYNYVISIDVIRDALRLEACAAPGFSLTLQSQMVLRKSSILDLEGLGADIWKGMDAKAYVAQLRGEWDAD